MMTSHSSISNMSRIRKAVFPVGGLGTRFLPATKSVPKELLPIIDKPLIQYAVDEARAAGIEEFIFITARGKSAIEDYFDISFELEEALQRAEKHLWLERTRASNLEPGQAVFTRQQQPLGLGHAVWCARNFIGQEPFAILLPDDLILGKTSCLQQMVDAYQELKGNVVAIMEVPKTDVEKYGIITPLASHNNIVSVSAVIEKPKQKDAPSQYAVIGRYILQPEVFNFLSKQKRGSGGEVQLTDAFNPLIQMQQPFHGFLFEGSRYDCGAKEGFILATLHQAFLDTDLSLEFKEILKNKFIAAD